MINILRILEAGICALIFVASILFSQSYIQLQQLKTYNSEKIVKARIKTFIMTLTVCSLIVYTYMNHCYNKIGILQCIYINPGQQLFRNVAIALFINTTLFLGGLHQQLYNGGIKKKFLRFYKREFQWGLFKKLFIVPLYIEIVYRALICRIIDPDLHHPSFFTFFAGGLYGFSHLVNFYRFWGHYGFEFSAKSISIQIIYNLVFGLYVSHIFSKSQTLISSLVLQVYANFMGYPQYFQIFKGQTSDDRIKKSTIFYLVGVAACLSCCLFL